LVSFQHSNKDTRIDWFHFNIQTIKI